MVDSYAVCLSGLLTPRVSRVVGTWPPYELIHTPSQKVLRRTDRQMFVGHRVSRVVVVLMHL